jgi:hypothetical protein
VALAKARDRGVIGRLIGADHAGSCAGRPFPSAR